MATGQARLAPFPFVVGALTATLKWITEPSAAVAESERGKWRLLSTFILLLTINCLMGALARRDLWPLLIAISAIFFAGFILIHTRFYRAAVSIAVILPAAPLLVMLLDSASFENPISKLMWVALPLLILSIVQSFGIVVIITGAYIAGILALGFSGFLNAIDFGNILSFILMVAFLEISFAAINQKTYSEMERQLAERKVAREKLEESEQKFRNLFEHTKDAILLAAADGGAIAGLFRSAGISRERVAVSLAGLSFTYRFFGLPRLKPALVAEAVRRAARQEMSLPLDELYLAWRAVPGKATAEQTYFVVGVPRHIVDAAVKAMAAARLPNFTLELQPLALARAAGRRDTIIVNLDNDCFDIIFMAEGLPAVMHTVHPGGEGATLEDNIRHLADELEKTAVFFQNASHGRRPDPATPLLVTGELATPTAAGLLQGEVTYAVETLAPPPGFPPDLPFAAYAASAGLALKDRPLEKKPGYYDIRLDLLAAPYRKTKARSLPLLKIIPALSLVTATALLYPLYHASADLKAAGSRLEDEFEQAEVDLAQAQVAAADAAAAEDIIKQTEDRAAALGTASREILNRRGSFSLDLDNIIAARPPAARLTAVTIEGDLLALQGTADNVFTAIDYATALEQTRYSEVRLSTMEEAPPDADGAGAAGGIKFEIVINR